jgi:hypothetical protein
MTLSAVQYLDTVGEIKHVPAQEPRVVLFGEVTSQVKPGDHPAH